MANVSLNVQSAISKSRQHSGLYSPASAGTHSYLFSWAIICFLGPSSVYGQVEYLNDLPRAANDITPGENGSVYLARGFYVDRCSPLGALEVRYRLDPHEGAADGIAQDEINLYMSSSSGSRIIVKNKATGTVSIWGGLGSDLGQFRNPTGVALGPDSSLYICDTGNCRIQKFSLDGTPILEFGQAGNNPGQFLAPWEIEISDAGKLFVADGLRNKVVVYSLSGDFIAEWGDTGSAPGEFNGVWGLAIDDRRRVYATDEGNERVQVFDEDGVFQFSWGDSGTLPGQFIYPWYIEIGSDSSIYVADGDGRVQRYKENLFISSLEPAEWSESWMADSTGLFNWTVGATWHGGQDITDYDPNGFIFADSIAQVGPAQFIPSHPILGVDAFIIPFRRCEVAAIIMNWDSSAVHGVGLTGRRFDGGSVQITGRVNLRASTWLSAIDPSDWYESWLSDSLGAVFWVLGGTNGTSVLDLDRNQFILNNSIHQSGAAGVIENDSLLGVDALRIPFRRSDVVASVDWDSLGFRNVSLVGRYTFNRQMHAATYATVRGTPRSTGVEGPGTDPLFLRIASHAKRHVSIEFSATNDSAAQIEIVDILGRRIMRMESLTGGSRVITWQGETELGGGAAAGMYIVSLQVGSRKISAKAVLLP